MLPHKDTTSRMGKIIASPNVIETEKGKQMRSQKNFFQTKEEEKKTWTKANEKEINNLLVKEFKALVIRMLT